MTEEDVKRIVADAIRRERGRIASILTEEAQRRREILGNWDVVGFALHGLGNKIAWEDE